MRRIILSFLVLSLVAIAPLAPSGLGAAGVAQADTTTVLVLDVAFDAATFVLHKVDPANTQGVRGDTFVLNGKIFEGGTIPPGDTFNPNGPGSIGRFICRGTSLVSDAEIAGGATPPWLVTTQTFVLNDGNALITDGQEYGQSPITRAVTGGWGKTHSGASGEVILDLIGYNITGFENYRCTFKLKKQAPK